MTEIQKNFTYHAPTVEQAEHYQQIRQIAQAFAEFIDITCPKSREKSLALTKLEEAVMWANASIARNS